MAELLVVHFLCKRADEAVVMDPFSDLGFLLASSSCVSAVKVASLTLDTAKVPELSQEPAPDGIWWERDTMPVSVGCGSFQNRARSSPSNSILPEEAGNLRSSLPCTSLQ